MFLLIYSGCITPRLLFSVQVKVWFQNRRTKYKRQKLEEEGPDSQQKKKGNHHINRWRIATKQTSSEDIDVTSEDWICVAASDNAALNRASSMTHQRTNAIYYVILLSIIRHIRRRLEDLICDHYSSLHQGAILSDTGGRGGGFLFNEIDSECLWMRSNSAIIWSFQLCGQPNMKRRDTFYCSVWIFF